MNVDEAVNVVSTFVQDDFGGTAMATEGLAWAVEYSGSLAVISLAADQDPKLVVTCGLVLGVQGSSISELNMLLNVCNQNLYFGRVSRSRTGQLVWTM